MPKTENLIQVQFESYLKEVTPAGVSANQVIETKRAFFAGAQAMMTIFRAIGSDRVSEEDAEKILEDAGRELESFCEAVKAGRA